LAASIRIRCEQRFAAIRFFPGVQIVFAMVLHWVTNE
jgi:hypothetical protein